jgi:hypothetical protein
VGLVEAQASLNLEQAVPPLLPNLDTASVPSSALMPHAKFLRHGIQGLLIISCSSLNKNNDDNRDQAPGCHDA